MKRLKKLLSGDFVKSVAVLTTGAVISQVISFAISPFLTRLYSPEQFADLNLYLRIVGFLSALSTARFELALPLPKQEGHAYLLYRLSVRIASYMLLSVSVLALFYCMAVEVSLRTVLFGVITVISTAFVVLTNLGTSWAIRNKLFRKISVSRVLNAGVGNGLRLGFGLLNWGSFGLLFASLVGSIAGSLGFLKEWLTTGIKYKSLRSNKKTRALVVAYKDFPLINLPHTLVDYGKDLLVAFFMIMYFSKDVFAWYSLSYTVLQLPIAVVGLAISQVFFSKAAELVNRGESTAPLLLSTVRTLFLISIVPFTLLYFFGTPLFSFVFGKDWANAGKYSEIMALWFLLNFLNSVVSNLPTVLHRQKEFFYLGIISAAIQLGGFGLLPLLMGSGEAQFPKILWIVSLVQCGFFVYVLFTMFRFSKKGLNAKY